MSNLSTHNLFFLILFHFSILTANKFYTGSSVSYFNNCVFLLKVGSCSFLLQSANFSFRTSLADSCKFQFQLFIFTTLLQFQINQRKLKQSQYPLIYKNQLMTAIGDLQKVLNRKPFARDGF